LLLTAEKKGESAKKWKYLCFVLQSLV